MKGTLRTSVHSYGARAVNAQALKSLCCALLLLLASCGRNGDQSHARRLATPRWEKVDGDGVLTRRDEATGDLLLRTKSTVYRFSNRSSRLLDATLAEWDKATGKVSEHYCSQPIDYDDHNLRPGLRFLLKVDDHRNKYELTFGGKRVATKGNAPFHGNYSPDRQYVAVRSVNGPPRSLPGWLSGGALTYNGPFYHDLFRSKDGTRAGMTVKLEDSRNAEYIMMTWSADGKQAVYFDWNYRYVWVVDAPDPPPSVVFKSDEGNNVNAESDTAEGKK